MRFCTSGPNNGRLEQVTSLPFETLCDFISGATSMRAELAYRGCSHLTRECRCSFIYWNVDLWREGDFQAAESATVRSEVSGFAQFGDAT